MPQVRLGAGKLSPAFRQVGFAGAHLNAPLMKLLNILCSQQQHFVTGEGSPFLSNRFELLCQGFKARPRLGIFQLSLIEGAHGILGK